MVKCIYCFHAKKEREPHSKPYQEFVSYGLRTTKYAQYCLVT